MRHALENLTCGSSFGQMQARRYLSKGVWLPPRNRMRITRKRNMTEFKSFYKTASGEEGTRCLYPDRLDLYGCGCFHDCAYCYAKSLLDFRGLWDAESPSKARIEDVRKVVSKMKPGSVVRLGGMTGCFQPEEERSKLTKSTIAFLNQRGVHYLIVTKSPLIATDEYMSALDHKLAHIQVQSHALTSN